MLQSIFMMQMQLVTLIAKSCPRPSLEFAAFRALQVE